MGKYDCYNVVLTVLCAPKDHVIHMHGTHTAQQHFTDKQVQDPCRFKQRVKQQPFCDVLPRVEWSGAEHYNAAVKEADDWCGDYEAADEVVECCGGKNDYSLCSYTVAGVVYYSCDLKYIRRSRGNARQYLSVYTTMGWLSYAEAFGGSAADAIMNLFIHRCSNKFTVFFSHQVMQDLCRTSSECCLRTGRWKSTGLVGKAVRLEQRPLPSSGIWRAHNIYKVVLFLPDFFLVILH